MNSTDTTPSNESSGGENLEELFNAEADKDFAEASLSLTFALDGLEIKEGLGERLPVTTKDASSLDSTNAPTMSELIEAYTREISEAKEDPKNILDATARMKKNLAVFDKKRKEHGKFVEMAMVQMKKNLVMIEKKTKEYDSNTEWILEKNQANDHQCDYILRLLEVEASEKEKLQKNNAVMEMQLTKMSEDYNELKKQLEMFRGNSKR